MGQSYPPPLELPADVVVNTNVVYYRFHGVSEPHKPSYSPGFMAGIAAEIATAMQELLPGPQC